MKKFSTLALAAAFGLAVLAPIGAAQAATTVHHTVVVHKTVTHTAMICHMAKEKDGKMHKLCHSHQHVAHHVVVKKTVKKV